MPAVSRAKNLPRSWQGRGAAGARAETGLLLQGGVALRSNWTGSVERRVRIVAQGRCVFCARDRTAAEMPPFSIDSSVGIPDVAGVRLCGGLQLARAHMHGASLLAWASRLIPRGLVDPVARHERSNTHEMLLTLLAVGPQIAMHHCPPPVTAYRGGAKHRRASTC